MVQLSGFGTDVWVKDVRDVQMFGSDTKAHVPEHGTDVLQMCGCRASMSGFRGQYRCFGNVVQMFECDTDVVQV